MCPGTSMVSAELNQSIYVVDEWELMFVTRDDVVIKNR